MPFIEQATYLKLFEIISIIYRSNKTQFKHKKSSNVFICSDRFSANQNAKKHETYRKIQKFYKKCWPNLDLHAMTQKMRANYEIAMWSKEH